MTSGCHCLVMSEAHLDKIVVEPIKWAHVKGIESTLLGLLVASVNWYEDNDNGFVAAISCN